MDLKDWDLHKAAEHNEVDIAKALIENGADVDKVTTKFGYTPIHHAAFNDSAEVAMILIENGAEVDRANIDGRTPLHAAAYGKSTVVAMILIENGADVNKTDKDGLIPLNFSTYSSEPNPVFPILFDAFINERKLKDHKKNMSEEISAFLDTLPKMERDVLKFRFGLSLNDVRPRTLEEVGREFGIARERIRQIERKALDEWNTSKGRTRKNQVTKKEGD